MREHSFTQFLQVSYPRLRPVCERPRCVRAFLSVSLAAAARVAAAAVAGSASAAEAPTLSGLARYATFRDASLNPSTARTIPPSWLFSPVTTTTGETVRIHLSRRLYTPTDTAVAQQWADFFGSLVHGPELATLDAYLMTLREVQSECGPGALACYGHNQIIAPADDPQIGLSAESVAAHEYGHHVAAHRLNTPWEAIDYGTKRWASYENVCSKTRKGVYYPGDETEEHYFENPGEGFAEAYRVLNERRLSLSEAPWNIVTNALYPDDNALTLLEQDVTTPWAKNRTLTRTGAVSTSTKSRSFVIQTPLDGRLTVRMSSSAKASFRLEVLSPTATRLARASGRNVSASAAICGQRALRLRVNRVSGAGAFKLAISLP
jgi:hypothetical protein